MAPGAAIRLEDFCTEKTLTEYSTLAADLSSRGVYLFDFYALPPRRTPRAATSRAHFRSAGETRSGGLQTLVNGRSRHRPFADKLPFRVGDIDGGGPLAGDRTDVEDQVDTAVHGAQYFDAAAAGWLS